MDPTALTAQRAGRPEHTPDAELVLVELQGDNATLTLDDGETLTFDRVELLAHLGVPMAAVVALDATRDDIVARWAA